MPLKVAQHEPRPSHFDGQSELLLLPTDDLAHTLLPGFKFPDASLLKTLLLFQKPELPSAQCSCVVLEVIMVAKAKITKNTVIITRKFFNLGFFSYSNPIF